MLCENVNEDLIEQKLIGSAPANDEKTAKRELLLMKKG